MGRRPNDVNFDELYSLKVDNLPYNTSIHELRRMFDRYGEIGDVYIPKDRYGAQSRGFGFVRFYSKKDAEYACSRVDGKPMNGRDLRVSLAKFRRPLDERNSRGGGDRDRRRGRYSRSRSPRRSRTRSPPRRSRSRTPRRSSRSRSRSPRGRRDYSRSRSPRNNDRSRSPSRSRSATRSRSP